MPRYIDAEKLIASIEHEDTDVSKNCGFYSFSGYSYQKIMNIINGQNTADVAPVVHGKWDYVDVDIVCSVCGGDGVLPWNKPTQEKFPFCPHCGAKMDLEE